MFVSSIVKIHIFEVLINLGIYINIDEIEIYIETFRIYIGLNNFTYEQIGSIFKNTSINYVPNLQKVLQEQIFWFNEEYINSTTEDGYS